MGFDYYEKVDVLIRTPPKNISNEMRSLIIKCGKDKNNLNGIPLDFSSESSALIPSIFEVDYEQIHQGFYEGIPIINHTIRGQNNYFSALGLEEVLGDFSSIFEVTKVRVPTQRGVIRHSSNTFNSFFVKLEKLTQEEMYSLNFNPRLTLNEVQELLSNSNVDYFI